MSIALPLRIRTREHRGAMVVSPAGVLNIGTYGQLMNTLLTCATAEPSAVIVDIGDLVLPPLYPLAVFTVVGTKLREWPRVPLLLVVTQPARRARLAASLIGRIVPVLPDLDAAMRAIGDAPARRRGRLALKADPASSVAARRFVHELCDEWGVAAAAEDAAAIATELVENVVQHTASTPELRLDLRNGLLSIAVADGDPRPAVLREAVIRAAPSAGLAIVATLSRTWGCTPTADGKVVWAVLPVRPG